MPIGNQYFCIFVIVKNIVAILSIYLLAFGTRVSVAATPALEAAETPDTCALVRIVPERMPDLSIPRSGYCIMYVGGELTIFGGHTTNFVPTQTAEYFDGDKWHLMEMAYTHDGGFAVQTGSGEVILGGGHSEPLGVGQTYMMERYDPSSHTFEGFGCLDRRRTLAQASLLGDGRVVIAGNHYAPDAIGCYDGRAQVQPAGEMAQGYLNPFILHTAVDNAIIVGDKDVFAHRVDTVLAQPLAGEAFRVPLLERWRLLHFDQPFSTEAAFTGDREKGEYSYLLAAVDSNGQAAIVQVRDTSFSLLPTVCPIPVRSPFGSVVYCGPVVVDRIRQRAYIAGLDTLKSRQYILAADYGTLPAALTLYYTDPMEFAANTIPVLSPEGDLIIAAGHSGSNYKPLSTVMRYRFAAESQEATAGWPFWVWALCGIAVIVAGGIFALFSRKGAKAATSGDAGDKELMDRLCQMLESGRMYLESHITQADVAAALGVNSADISGCIKACRNITFAQLIAEYRVHYAQKLLSDNPEMKLYTVMTESGFTSESTFYRTFKSVTGVSPKEWLSSRESDRL